VASVDLELNVGVTPKDPFAGIKRSLDQLDGKAESAIGSFKAISGALVGIGAASAAFDFVLDSTRQMEDLTTQFIAFTGSAEGATEQLERLSSFASTSPFALADVAEANRTLLAFGSTTAESIEQLRQLGEVSAATGTNLQDLARIFGQIQAEGKLTGERFNQLIERGVNIGPELAKSLGVASTSIKSLISDGKISAEEVEKAFQKMTAAGGQFAGSTERLSKTVSGSLSTLQDNFSILAATIGTSAIPAFTSLVNIISKATEGNIAYLKEQKKIASENDAQKRIRAIGEEIKALDETLVQIQQRQKGGILNESPEKAKALADSFNAVTASIRELSLERLKLVKGEGIAESSKKDAEAAAAAEKVRADQQEQRRAKQKEEADKLAEEQKKAAEAELKSIQEKEKKITETALLEASVRNEILKEQEGAQNAEKLARLQEREAELTAVRMQTEADRQEQLKQYDLAELTRDQVRVNQKIQIERAAEAKRIADLKKANADKNQLEIQAQEANQKFLESSFQKRVETSRVGIAALASLQKSGSREAFMIGKRAAQAQVLLDIPKAAFAAYTSLIGTPYIGPIIAPIAAAAAVLAGQQQLRAIEAQQFAMKEGGIVPGVGSGDKVPILAEPGELVVPKQNFADLQMGQGLTADNLVLMQQSIEIQGKILDVMTIGSVGEKLTSIVSQLNTMVAKLDALGSGAGDGGFPVPPAEEPQTNGGPLQGRRGPERERTNTRDSKGMQTRDRFISEV